MLWQNVCINKKGNRLACSKRCAQFELNNNDHTIFSLVDVMFACRNASFERATCTLAHTIKTFAQKFANMNNVC